MTATSWSPPAAASACTGKRSISPLNEIENDFQPALMCLVNQRVEISKHTEYRGDIAVVCNVIAEVDHRRWIDWRNPNPINSKPRQVVQPPPNSVRISDAIAIAVPERPRIDLIDNSAFPPYCIDRYRLLPSTSRRVETVGADQRDHGRLARERQEEELDDTLKNTFPASDPVSIAQPAPLDTDGD
jgi:hypothetical protein